MWGMFGALVGLQHTKKLLMSVVVRFQIFLRENKAILFFSPLSPSRSALFRGTFLLPSFSRE